MASERPLTTSEAANGLGVSRSTVKNWIKEFSLGAIRDARGDWRIDPDALPVFEEVKRLRDEGLGLDSIRRVIGAPAPAAVREPVARPGLVTRYPVAPAAYDDPGTDLVADDGMRQAFCQALEAQERMAMQLARLAHTNGQLQAQLKHATSEVPRLQHALEQSQGRAAMLVGRIEHLETQLAPAQGAIEAARQDVEVARRDADLARRDADVARRAADVALDAARAEAQAELGQAREAADQQAAAAVERARALEAELANARGKLAEMAKAAAARPRSGMGMHFHTEESQNQQLLELQKELIKSKERIAAFEAAEYERTETKRPWWNFWD